MLGAAGFGETFDCGVRWGGFGFGDLSEGHYDDVVGVVSALDFGLLCSESDLAVAFCCGCVIHGRDQPLTVYYMRLASVQRLLSIRS